MIGDRPAGMLCPQAFDSHHIGKKTDELECPFRERISTRPQVGIVVEQVWQVVFQHTPARARRHHDVVVPAERVEDSLGEVACRGPVAEIVSGLTAAGLRTRQFDLAAGLLQQSNCREADRRTVQIDQAGDE